MNTHKEHWPLTLAQAAHIARIERWRGTDAEIAAEYGVDEALIRSIRDGDGYKGRDFPLYTHLKPRYHPPMIKDEPMMDYDPDPSQAYHQSHYGTQAEAEAMAQDIEKLAGLQNEPIPRTEITKDRQGGWNVWIWE